MATDTRERIIKQAIDLFYTNGYTRTSVRDLANALDITQASIYNHFTNKDDVLFTIMNRLGRELLMMLKETESEFQDPVECLEQMIYRHLCMFRNKKKEFKIFVDELNRLPGHLEKFCSVKHRQIFEAYRDKVSEIEDQNLGNSIDRTSTAFSILGVIIWFYRWVNIDGPLSIERAADEIIRLIFFGLLKQDANGPTEGRSQNCTK